MYRPADAPVAVTQPWWQRGAIYQIYPRSFADSDGDGVGDLPGILGKLDHLVNLGVQALWLSPFYPSPMKDFGYDVADYCGVDDLFGTLDDFDALIAAVHARGLKLVVDWVPNHTSDQHPWFSDPGRAHFYVRRAAPPNHWRTQFTQDGPAWSREPERDGVYLHSFLPAQPDLNWDEPEVREAMHATLRFWLDRGVDGFRIDVVYRLGKDPALGENEPGRRHDQDWPSIHPRLQEIRAVLEEFGDEKMAVGEIYLSTQSDIARYVASDQELHMAHNFFLLEAQWSAAAYRKVIGEWLELLGERGWAAWCLGNHDHSRLATRLGPARARAAAVLLVTLRGTPFVFQGDELGLQDVPIPPDRVVDVDGRDPERAPIPWAAGAGAGFTAGDAWLPITPDADRVNAAVQADDPGSMLSLYRRLLGLRTAEPALREGPQSWLEAGEDVLSFSRGPELLVAVNFASEPRTARLGDGHAEVLAATGDRTGGVDLNALSLAPDEALILRRDERALESVDD
jgi:alpha-glucosidase